MARDSFDNCRPHWCTGFLCNCKHVLDLVHGVFSLKCGQRTRSRFRLSACECVCLCACNRQHSEISENTGNRILFVCVENTTLSIELQPTSNYAMQLPWNKQRCLLTQFSFVRQITLRSIHIVYSQKLELYRQIIDCAFAKAATGFTDALRAALSQSFRLRCDRIIKNRPTFHASLLLNVLLFGRIKIIQLSVIFCYTGVDNLITHRQANRVFKNSLHRADDIQCYQLLPQTTMRN